MPDKKILLLDPFENVLDVYRFLLEDEDYQVHAAKNLKEAYESLASYRYTAFITEFISSSEEMVRLIRSVKENSPETCIIISTWAPIDDLTYEKLFEAGADDLLIKPYAPEKILVHIRKGLKHPHETLLDPVAQKANQVIFSPSFFDRSIRLELKKAQRHHHPLSMIFLKMPSRDLMGERFEPFYIELIKILRNSVREEDILGRRNGSLGLVLYHTDKDGTKLLCQRLSQRIHAHPTFESDRSWQSVLKKLSFQHYTFPDVSNIPKFLGPILKEIYRYPVPPKALG